MSRISKVTEGKMGKEELVAFGRIAKTIDCAITEKEYKKGKPALGLRQSEWDGMALHPKTTIGGILQRAASLGAVTGKYDEILMYLFDDIDSASDYGTLKNPISLEDQGVVMVAYYQFDPNLMDSDEAAKRLDVSKQRLYKLLQDGKLHGLKVNGKWKVCKKSLDVRVKIKNGNPDSTDTA